MCTQLHIVCLLVPFCISPERFGANSQSSLCVDLAIYSCMQCRGVAKLFIIVSMKLGMAHYMEYVGGCLLFRVSNVLKYMEKQSRLLEMSIILWVSAIE